MDIGTIGAGDFAQAFAKRVLKAGHKVKISNSRGPGSLREIVRRLGPGATAVTREEAAACEIVLLAVPWDNVPETLAGLREWKNQILIDGVNPFHGKAGKFAPADVGNLSTSQFVAALAPGARVVKALNHMIVSNLEADPVVNGARRVAFISADDDGAKKQVRSLLKDCCYSVVELGNLRDGGLIQQAGGPLAGRDFFEKRRISQVKAIHLTAYGDPTQNLKMVEVPEPKAPAAGEALVRMEYAPINDSDLLLARGMYLLRPKLPSVIGGEGAGIVESVGPGVTGVKAGDRVTIPFGTFTWTEKVVAPADGLFVVPPSIDARTASMLNINPTTAVLLLSEFVKLKPKDWIILNAANSQIARCLIAIAKSRGLNIAGVVRRPEVIPEVEKLGVDFVGVESPELPKQIQSATGGAPITLGLDAVGGPATATMASALAPGAHLVVYAWLSRMPIHVPPPELIVKRLNIHGFWMYYGEYLPKIRGALTEAANVVASGKITLPFATTYIPSQIKEAIVHTERGGKVLLDFNQPNQV